MIEKMVFEGERLQKLVNYLWEEGYQFYDFGDGWELDKRDCSESTDTGI